MSCGNERRTWNTPLRKPWNPVIKACINAIDYHVAFYFITGNKWHMEQAAVLRNYITELKTWIQEQEGKI